MMKNEFFTDDVIKTLSKLSDVPESFDERDRLIMSFPTFNIPKAYQDDILEAYDHFQLYPDKFDGTTGADEQWATLYEKTPRTCG